ncbi:MAG: MarR family winged helix-turn-helix transcriptional regulator [Sarcina sp.]
MTEHKFEDCLFFTATRLYRIATKIAEDEFKKLGMSPSYVYILLGVKLKPGITQKELCKELHLTPSTITRLVDKLVGDSFIRKEMEGKLSHIFLTDKGKEIQEEIEIFRESLHKRYKEALGEEDYKNLIKLTNQSAIILEDKERDSF